MFDIFKKKNIDKLEKKSETYFPSPFWLSWLNWLWPNEDLKINQTLFYKMFRANSDLRRCIEEIQQAIWSEWFELRTLNSDWEYEIINDLLIEKILNSYNNFNFLKNEIIKHFLISWNVFILKTKNARQQANSYKVLDTRFMSVITDTDYNVVRYTYFDPRVNKQFNYSIDEIYHYKNISDIDNPIFWMSLLEGIVYDVMWDKEANISNYYFFKNDALPSALYVLEQGLSTDEQKAIFENLRMQLEWSYNKHKNIISWNIVDIKQIQNTHKDMDFLEQRKYTTEKICACMWVPRSILNYTDWINYTNADTQYKKFVDNTIKPNIDMVSYILTSLINQDFKKDIIVYISNNLIDDLKDKTEIANKNVSNWIWTRNEAREYLWMTKSDIEVLNEFTIWQNNILIDDLLIRDVNTNIQSNNNQNV